MAGRGLRLNTMVAGEKWHTPRDQLLDPLDAFFT